MPNPYKGNDKAAYTVSYYASDRMINESVYRLHQQAMNERHREIERLDKELYPESHAPVRTPEEMKRYLDFRVTKEMLRRQQRRAALERELYPERFSKGPQLKEDELQEHILRLYKPDANDSKRAIENGPGSPPSSVNRNRSSHSNPPSIARGVEKGQERPVWRPSFGADKKDYRAFLDQLYAPPPRPKTKFDEKKHEARILALSQPLHVADKPSIRNSSGNDSKPAFKVSRKVDLQHESARVH